MRPMRFIVIGSGWRSLFYARIAETHPEQFELCALLCRSQEKAEMMQREFHVPATASERDCEAARPDFVVVAVSKASIFEVTREWAKRGYPVLCETPAALRLEDLEELWRMNTEQGTRIQVAEQYTRYPAHAARIALLKQGILGDPYAVTISMVHDYHAASLIRSYLGISLQGVRISGRRYCFPVVETDSRWGPVTDGRIREWDRSVLNFEFSSGKMALYDFTGVQYHSYIRARHLSVQGVRGEMADSAVRYVEDNCIPVEQKLSQAPTPDGKGIRRITAGDLVLYENPFGDKGMPEDETAIGTLMLGMAEYIRSGREVYPMAEALEDAYTMILMNKALETPGCTVESETQIWNQLPLSQ